MTLGPLASRLRGMVRNVAAATNAPRRATRGSSSRTCPRSMFAASRQSTTKPIAETTAMYVLSLPTIAQVSLDERFDGKQPIWT
jgi:hypothetical protein